MQLQRAVITGLGALTPIGNTKGEFSRALMNGVGGAAPITKFDASAFSTRFACEVKGFDPLDHMEKKEARKMDTYAHYALATAGEALRDAEMNLDAIDRSRAGVIWASGIGGLATLEDQVLAYSATRERPRFNPFFIPKMIANIGAGLISIKFGLKGLNFATVSACTSSTHALIDALNYIRLGKADIIVTGGSEAAITATGIGGFASMKALSQRNDAPETASRPFDAQRDGFVLGDGAAALIVESLDHARRRGARIYAELAGGGMTADAYHMTATHPEGEGAYAAMQLALDDAGLAPHNVDYLNAHATSTPVGDLSEAAAIRRLFADHLDRLDISATKSMTGHLLGAAGAVEAVASILAITENRVPPTINSQTPDPSLEPALRLNFGAGSGKEINVSMSNTFGFGGHNAIAVFRRYHE